MIRLMLTLTPCVCVLAAIALSKTLDYYADTESSEMTSNTNENVNEENNDENDNDNEKNNRNLYDKVGKPTKRRHESNATNQDGDNEGNIVASNIKTIVVICSKIFHFV